MFDANQITKAISQIKVDEASVKIVLVDCFRTLPLNNEQKNAYFQHGLAKIISAMHQMKKAAFKKYVEKKEDTFQYCSNPAVTLNALIQRVNKNEFPLLLEIRKICSEYMKIEQSRNADNSTKLDIQLQDLMDQADRLVKDEAAMTKEIGDWVQSQSDSKKLIAQMSLTSEVTAQSFSLSEEDRTILKEIDSLKMLSIYQRTRLPEDVIFRRVKDLLFTNSMKNKGLAENNSDNIRRYTETAVVQMLLPKIFELPGLDRDAEIGRLFDALNYGCAQTRHKDFSEYIRRVNELNLDTSKPICTQVHGYMLDLINQESRLPKASVTPEIKRQVGLRRLDRLAIVLQPAMYSQCAAVAIDHEKKRFIIGSNANDANDANDIQLPAEENTAGSDANDVKKEQQSPDKVVAKLIHEKMCARLALIQLFALNIRNQSRQEKWDISNQQARRDKIFKAIAAVNLVESMEASGGYDSKEEIAEHLTKIIDSYVFTPADFGCSTEAEVDRLFTVKSPEAENVALPIIMVPDLEVVQFYKEQFAHMQHLKVSGIHAEQLVISFAFANRIKISAGNVGISKFCCGVCARLFRENFPDMKVSGAHENVFPNTADVIIGTITSVDDSIVLNDSPMKRAVSDATPEDTKRIDPNGVGGVAPTLVLDSIASDLDKVVSSPYSPRFHRAAAAAGASIRCVELN